MPIVPNLTPQAKAQRYAAIARKASAAAPAAAPVEPKYWPFLDSMYDYLAFLGQGPYDQGPPIAALPQGPAKTIGIVGAGAAGMVAAYELLRAGFNPVVFEATDRIGGRNYSLPFDANDPNGGIAEMGAMRVPKSNETFYYYASTLFNMGTTAFPDPGVAPTQIYYQNTRYDWKPHGDPPAPFAKLKQDFIVDWVSELTAPIYANWTPNLEANPWWQYYVSKYAGMSFYSALAQGIPQWTDEDLSAFGALGMGSGGFGPLYEVGFLEMLRLLTLGWEVDQQLMTNGINALTDNLYTTTAGIPGGKSLRDLGAVLLESPVTAIDVNGSQPIVAYTPKGGTPAQMTVDALIVATTTRSMEISMGLTLPAQSNAAVLSAAVQSSLRDLPQVNSSKLFIRTETKFWNDPALKLPQTIQTDELPRGIYCLDYPDTDFGVVLISYTWQDDSSKLLALPPPQRFRVFKSIIEKINPDFAKWLVPVGGDDGIINIDWEATPYYYGAFKLNYPGQEPDCAAAYYQFLSVLDASNDKGVYLAGDSVSWAGGWTEGALQTGINAACAAAQHAGATVRPGSPLTQNPKLYDYSNTGSIVPPPPPGRG